jgi:hypothetical protein
MRIVSGHHITMWWPEHVQSVVDAVRELTSGFDRPDEVGESADEVKW